MRYIMPIYSEQQRPNEERDFTQHWNLIEEASRAGVFIVAEPLTPASSATTLRASAGRTLICDAPFAETKEQLTGYYVLECRDLDQAIDWASKVYDACTGITSVEIRPMPGMPARHCVVS